ncbi:hypothetical protein [Herbiconiux daphne]|uniref:Ig-like domain-containing protein n=1 Tax=Herbiconiux daphne TaxID=2970914 RepID=A0ABT2H6J9_9MICO|nr:hypothetical protein [Herbiconiux daphne]MCS5735551.1 hypothetical protein [Herbiconiux daphne]
MLAITGAAGVATAELSTPPGTPIIETLGEPTSGTFTGTGTLDLGPVPAGANGIAVTVTCLTAGSFTFGEFGTKVCAEGDVSTTSWGTVPLGLDQQRTVTIETTADASWSISAGYTKTIETEWGVNEAGQTFGAPKGDQNPDLTPAYALNCKRGYLSAAEVDALFDENMTMEEVKEYINGVNRYDRYLNVYDSDGVTVIGQALVPGTDSEPITINCP